MTDMIPTEKDDQEGAVLLRDEEASNDTTASASPAVTTRTPPSKAAAAAPANKDDEEPQQQQQQQQQQGARQDDDKKEDRNDDDKNVDDEGLLRDGYDVVLCGTSLVHAILASALARAGKKVLHCDAADYYGELDAVWTLPYVQEQEQPWRLLREQQQPQQDDDGQQQQPDDNYHAIQKDDSSTSILELSSSGGLQGFQIHSMARVKDDDFCVVSAAKKYDGSDVMTPYGKGRVVVLMKQNDMTYTTTAKSLSISLTDWKLANGTCPTLFVGIPSSFDLLQQQQQRQQQQETIQNNDANNANDAAALLNRYLIHTAQIIPQAALVAREILDCKSRSFALDISPALLYAHGPAVQGLLTSRVADYVEFKSLQGLWWYHHDNDNENTSRRRLEMVPCSKNDVFTSTLLTPMEKRRLMKFLQLALDYATAQEAAAAVAADAQEAQGNAAAAADDNDHDNNSNNNNTNNLAIVQSLNERHLNQGRSLARPQNKAVNTSDMETLQQCIAKEMDFDAYLQEKHSLSPKLRSLVRYALALEVMGSNSSNSVSENKANKNKPLLVEQGMKRLCRHMQALGRFGSTAFLIPLYGSGELSQAFCRSAAVYGATYILRRCMRGIVIVGGAGGAVASSDDNGNDATLQQQQQQHAAGVLISQPTGNESSSSSPSTLPVASSSLRDLKHIPCQHVVIPESALLRQEQHGQHRHHAKVAHRRVLRRISILQGKPKILLQSKQSKEDNSNSSRQCRHAIILPPGSLDGSAHSSTSCPQPYTIQGLVLDESVNVAPHIAPDGCSIVHLSTIVDVAAVDNPTDVTEGQSLLLKRALDTVILANDATVQEIFHVYFSFPLYDDDDDNSNIQSQHEEHIKGLHVVRRPPPSLTVDPDFEQAREIFNRICPGAEFLTLSKEIETAVKERFGDACNPNDADDDEKLVLESAMGMIGGNNAASSSIAGASAGPLFIWLGHYQDAEETATGPARTPAHKLLLPVPRPSTPNVTVVGSQEQATSETATTSEQVLKLIRKHYSTPGASSDPRIYFASPWEGDDIMEYSVLIKESIVAVKKAGFSQFSYHVFTSGLVTPLAQTRLADLGIDCFHVSLLAGSKAEYAESTGRGVKIDATEEEDGFTKVCGFISNAVQHHIAVEASVLKRYEESGRVLARSLGAREVHVFDQDQA